MAIFPISPQRHMLWYSLEVPCRGSSNDYKKRVPFYGEIRKFYVGTPSYLEQSGYL